MSQSVTIETGLGRIQFSVEAEPRRGPGHSLGLDVFDLHPVLPPGMWVRRARAILLTASSPKGFERIGFSCRVETDTEGSPLSGERLDAQSWIRQHEAVMVGTEDAEALVTRMPWLAVEDDPRALVEYRRDGFQVLLHQIPSGARVELHYIVAENDHPEAVELSSWFAVDVAHARLEELRA